MKNKTTGKKEKILEAGLEVFASKGFNDTTVDDIVVKSECGKGTFYKYFKSKEELFDSLYNQFTEKLIEEIHTRCDYTMKPFDFFYNYITGFISVYEQDRRIALIKFAKAKMLVDDNKQNKVINDSHSLKITSFLRDYIINQITTGNIKQNIDVNAVYTCVVGVIQHILFVYFKENRSFSKNELVDIVNIIMNGAAPVC